MISPSASIWTFSILLRIDLVFGVPPGNWPAESAEAFSILLRIDLVFGEPWQDRSFTLLLTFQYPLADRLGFWGWHSQRAPRYVRSFSILLRIDLVFGDHGVLLTGAVLLPFSILLRIDLVFGALLMD